MPKDKRDSMISARFPSTVKTALEEIAEYFDLSMADVLIRFARAGISDFNRKRMAEFSMQKNSKKILALE
jgi:hypothetical protein